MTMMTMTSDEPRETSERSGALDQMPEALVRVLEEELREHHERARHSHAAELLEVLVQARPGCAHYWALLGHTRRKLGQRGQALQALRQAVECDPEDRDGLVELGELLCQLGRPVEGVELLELVYRMSHDPTLPLSKQDRYTLRAGAVLEAFQMALELGRAERPGSPEAVS